MPVSSDRQERERVRSRIGSLIMEFCAIQMRHGGTFYMEELRGFVERKMGAGSHIAPDSPGRILRQLRQQRRLNYKVVSRTQSLYRMKRPAEQAELFAARAS